MDNNCITENVYLLSGGPLFLAPLDSSPDWSLFRVAERINPKRAFLFVSTVLGRHVPVTPSRHKEAVEKLAVEIPDSALSEPVLVMGYAETAVGLGALMTRILRGRSPSSVFHLPTTRHPIENRTWFAFEESHSHAPGHHVLNPWPTASAMPSFKTLVLVDDETTTGQTFAELAERLVSFGVRPERVFLVTLTDWSDGHARARVQDVCPFATVQTVSLFHGRWRFEPDPTASVPAVPSSSGLEIRPKWTASPVTNPLCAAPRLGEEETPAVCLDDWRARGLHLPEKGARVLVVGSGEHVWGPFLLAEALEKEGFAASFVATTRSPVKTGEAITHKATFSDHFGLGIPMYLHNVDPMDWDMLLFMGETPATGVCPALKKALPCAQGIDGQGQIFSLEVTA